MDGDRGRQVQPKLAHRQGRHLRLYPLGQHGARPRGRQAAARQQPRRERDPPHHARQEELPLLRQPRGSQEHDGHLLAAGHLPQPRHQPEGLPQRCHQSDALSRQGNTR